METKVLYHYVHCPFCIRVRMGLGYLNQSYQSVVVPYDDEKTPIQLTGVKMLPIITLNGVAMNESLDILAALDQSNLLKVKETTESLEFVQFEKYLAIIGDLVHSLAMPYWIYTPEFTENSRKYFQTKKEVKRGPFKELVKKRAEFETKVMLELEKLTLDIEYFYRSNEFTLYDILLSSHLWGLYVVPEFQFPIKVHHYLQKIKNLCHFDYHEDFWR